MSQRANESRAEYLVRYAADRRIKRAAGASVANRERTLRDARIEKIWGRPRPAQCELCGGDNKGRKIHADHSHKTGQPRLFLCNRCNTLGAVVENEWLRIQMLVAYFRSAQDVGQILGRTNLPVSPIASSIDVAWIRAKIEHKSLAESTSL